MADENTSDISAEEGAAQAVNPNGKAYWRANLTFIIILLTIWALVSFVAAIILAEPLNDVQFFEIPLSYWFAHQGSMVIFVILIWVYAFGMDRIDKKYDVHE